MENVPIAVVGREGHADETEVHARGPATPSPSGQATASSDAGAPQVANGTPAAPGADRAADGTIAEGEPLPPMPPELAEIYRLLSLRFNFNDPEPSPPRDEHRP